MGEGRVFSFAPVRVPVLNGIGEANSGRTDGMSGVSFAGGAQSMIDGFGYNNEPAYN